MPPKRAPADKPSNTKGAKRPGSPNNNSPRSMRVMKQQIWESLFQDLDAGVELSLVEMKASIAMVLDTGASSVVLTHEAAKAAGLPLEVLNYSVNVDTANGRTTAAPVMIDSIAVGGLTERAVPALVARPGQLRSSLLGMSFLNRLESWEVRADRLMLRGYP